MSEIKEVSRTIMFSLKISLRFAFDTARKLESTVKRELMRPELDSQTFIQFTYWDAGRKGLS